MQKAAVRPALGIGDALLMMIASNQLQLNGYQVTTFHNLLSELSPWFPGLHIQQLPSIETLVEFDLILIENDNSPKVKEILARYPDKVSIFYPTYLASKHPPLSPKDQVFNKDLPMADNIAHAISTLLKLPSLSKNNGLTPPSPPSRKENQILIHPTSRVPAKNWRAKGFIKVAQELKKQGYHPLICVSPAEENDWNSVKTEGLTLICPANLSEFAHIVYASAFAIGNDSIMGHLASNLNIPTLIIANEEERMRLWRPGWHPGDLVLPPSYLARWKFLHLRDRHWQKCITVRSVLRSFDKLTSAL